MVLFIDRFIELRMEVSATQLCGNMHKLNRAKRRLYEHLCVDICGKFWLWSNISRRIEASMCSHRLKIRTTHWILGKDLSSGQRCPPFHTTGPKRFVCVVINCFLFSVLIFFTYDPVADADLQIRWGGGVGDWSHKKFFSALRASVWCKNKDPGPSPESATVTCIDRTGLNSFSLLFIRLRKGEVESKPTLVALSRDSGKRSSTGESDGFTDNEYSYTDDDTDGERLVTGNKPLHVTGSADNVRYSIFFLVFQCHFDLYCHQFL